MNPLLRLAVKALEEEAAPVAKKAAPAIIKARSGTAAATAADVLHEVSRKGKKLSYADWRAKNPDNGRILDMGRLSAVPNVPQHQIPRLVPPRGPSERIVEALGRPEVAKGINDTVERGAAAGGLEWYNTEPLRDFMGGAMPSIDVDPQYASLMDLVAATSPRSKVTDNVRTASYYNYLRSQGLPIPEKPAAGYGSIAQNLHRDNVRGLNARGGWDVFKNPKPASFSSNLQGNQEVATIDTHNFRLPGVLSEDPRFLETSIAELAKSPEIAADTLRRHFPRLPDDVIAAAVRPKGKEASIIYRPQEWLDKGYITPGEAAKDPAVWASKPRPNEYGYYEKWQQDQAKKMGISPAQYQASMWLGGGEDTGLGSAPEPFLATLEARARYTADRLGLPPEKILEQMVRGDIPLMAEGGRVEAPDYDMAGAKAAGVKPDARGHMPDTYKLPNHMTFSEDSVHSTPEHTGGKWLQSPDGKWQFWPSQYNMSRHPMPEMQDYFNRVEPDSFAVYPSGYKMPGYARGGAVKPRLACKCGG